MANQLLPLMPSHVQGHVTKSSAWIPCILTHTATWLSDYWVGSLPASTLWSTITGHQSEETPVLEESHKKIRCLWGSFRLGLHLSGKQSWQECFSCMRTLLSTEQQSAVITAHLFLFHPSPLNSGCPFSAFSFSPQFSSKGFQRLLIGKPWSTPQSTVAHNGHLVTR